MITSTQLLALDTSTEACTVALLAGGVVYERHEIIPRRHNQEILSMVKALLIEANTALTDLDAIVFGCGPGSFTGVRIAASVTQGLAFGAGLPVTPVSTLQTLAQGAYRELGAQQVLTGWDARMDEVYWGQYALDSSEQIMLPLIEDGLYAPDAVPLPASGGSAPPSSLESGKGSAVPALPLVDEKRSATGTPSLEKGTGRAVAGEQGDAQRWLAVGTAWQAYEALIMARCAPVITGEPIDRYPKARDALALGLYYFNRGLRQDATCAHPVYLRNDVTG